MTSIRVGILGATGYTALELIRILLQHPQVRITAATTRQQENRPLAEVHPSLAGRIDVACENLSATEIANRCDFVFCALPHGASMAIIPELLDAGCRIVDLSADYRLDCPELYRNWYGLDHSDPDRLKQTIYGLPEIGTLDLTAVNLVANPGCYTSTSILGLAPLVHHGLTLAEPIIIDAKSGVSGAGRALKLGTLFAECNESISAYAVGHHRHTPEIAQVLGTLGKNQVDVIFTPHLIPMDRGILCTMYPKLGQQPPIEELVALYRDYYQDSPFIRVIDGLPRTKDVSGTNFCDIALRYSGQQLIVLATTDNLIKGAAGVAVQNFNLMYGFPETTALLPSL